MELGSLDVSKSTNFFLRVSREYFCPQRGIFGGGRKSGSPEADRVDPLMKEGRV